MTMNRQQRRRQKQLARRVAKKGRGDDMGGPIAPLLEAAVGHHRAGEVRQAERLYRRVLEIDPRQGDAAHLLGVLRTAGGDSGEAISLLDRAVSLDPTVPAFHVSRVVALKALGRLEEAVAAYDTAIGLNPDDADCRYNQGLTLVELGRLDDALAAFDRALERNPRFPAALNNRALALQDQGRLNEAIDSFDRALLIDQNAAEVHNNRGLALQDVGRPEEAIFAFDEALRLQPKFAVAHCNRGDALCEVGRPGEALDSFGRALGIAPGFADAFCGQAVALLKKGDGHGALGALDRCLELAPGHIRALAFKVIALQETGRVDEARALVDPARFPVRTSLQLSPRYAGLNDFLSALRDHVLAQPTLAWEPHGKTTRKGSQTARLSPQGGGVFADFVHFLKAAVDRFLGGLPVSTGHPHFFRVPREYRLSIWATVLEGGGHQLPHIHPSGWLSGVYYVSLPPTITDDDREWAGWFEVGRPPADLPVVAESESTMIKPEPGLLLLFPSYLFHRTVPVRGAETRISIAFDVEPLSFAAPA